MKDNKHIQCFNEYQENLNISDVSISVSDLYKLIRNFISFDDAKICKHKVALDILNLIEKSGNKISVELVKSIINADDENTIKILTKH